MPQYDRVFFQKSITLEEKPEALVTTFRVHSLDKGPELQRSITHVVQETLLSYDGGGP
jgi:hypothetical protein